MENEYKEEEEQFISNNFILTTVPTMVEGIYDDTQTLQLSYWGDLTPADLDEAWNIVFEKYNAIRKFLQLFGKDEIVRISLGEGATCGLCAYHRYDCAECPIAIFAGHDYCVGTPYQDMARALRQKLTEFCTVSHALESVEKEIAFLEGVRDLNADCA